VRAGRRTIFCPAFVTKGRLREMPPPHGALPPLAPARKHSAITTAQMALTNRGRDAHCCPPPQISVCALRDPRLLLCKLGPVAAKC
jgi:hypothetical protein